MWRDLPRALLPTVLAALFVAGCAEQGAMPTEPLEPVGTDLSPWRRIFPATTAQDLNATWGLDVDDMWAVGDHGVILRYDGEAVTAVPSPTMDDLIAIDGCARDEVWAASQFGDVLHWDGRHWALVRDLQGANLQCIHCLAPGRVMVGGQRSGQDLRGTWLLDGGSWSFQPLPGDTPHHLWHPDPGFPVMAASYERLYRFEEGAWRPTTADMSGFGHAHGTLVLARDPDSWYGYRAVFRLQPDGSLSKECRGFTVGGADLIVDARRVLIGSGQKVKRLDDCLGVTMLELAFSLHDLIRPVLPGPQGRHAFAVGARGGFARLTWIDDRAMTADLLLLEEHNRPVRKVLGDGAALWFVDQDYRLYRRPADGDWRRVTTPFDVHDAVMLEDGRLVIVNTSDPLTFAVGPLDRDAWQELPPLPRSVGSDHWWIDEELRPRAAFFDHDSGAWQLWALEGQTWSLLCDLSAALDVEWLSIDQLAGFGPHDLYLRIWMTDDYHLLHHDGEDLRVLFPDEGLRIDRICAGRLSDRLYLEGVREDGAFSGYLADGGLVDHPGRVFWHSVCEVAADQVFCFTYWTIHRLEAAGWQALAGPEERRYQDLWGHPDQGLFLTNDLYEIHHRELTSGRHER